MSSKILVAYASYTGSTIGVAEAIGRTLAEDGSQVDVRPVKEVAGPNGYTAVVIGSAVHSGRWLPEAEQFVRTHRDQLRRMPVAFFQVGLMIATGSEDNRRMAATFLESMRALVNPVSEGRFAGYLWYNKYSFVERVGMRIFAATQKLSEGDYRDWNAIRAWAADLKPLLAS